MAKKNKMANQTNNNNAENQTNASEPKGPSLLNETRDFVAEFLSQKIFPAVCGWIKENPGKELTVEKCMEILNLPTKITSAPPFTSVLTRGAGAVKTATTRTRRTNQSTIAGRTCIYQFIRGKEDTKGKICGKACFHSNQNGLDYEYCSDCLTKVKVRNDLAKLGIPVPPEIVIKLNQKARKKTSSTTSAVSQLSNNLIPGVKGRTASNTSSQSSTPQQTSSEGITVNPRGDGDYEDPVYGFVLRYPENSDTPIVIGISDDGKVRPLTEEERTKATKNGYIVSEEDKSPEPTDEEKEEEKTQTEGEEKKERPKPNVLPVLPRKTLPKKN